MSAKPEYEEIKCPVAMRLDEAVKLLQQHNANGEKVCMEFNGVMLRSDTVTMDSAYLEVVGYTKAEYDQRMNEWRERLDREKKEHEAKIPELTEEYIARGHDILDKKYWVKWEECVPIRLSDLYQGMELGNCLEIVEALNSGESLQVAKEIIDAQGHSGMSYGLVRAMVATFCDRGEEFAEYVK